MKIINLTILFILVLFFLNILQVTSRHHHGEWRHNGKRPLTEYPRPYTHNSEDSQNYHHGEGRKNHHSDGRRSHRGCKGGHRHKNEDSQNYQHGEDRQNHGCDSSRDHSSHHPTPDSNKNKFWNGDSDSNSNSNSHNIIINNNNYPVPSYSSNDTVPTDNGWSSSFSTEYIHVFSKRSLVSFIIAFSLTSLVFIITTFCSCSCGCRGRRSQYTPVVQL
ncbi:expressed protein [Dictyostelium purpureum]|uniref:Expressed protein n=1 Tax=Dictyostelium purpureum TaxID=5786 RepID=F0ZZ75_DICPU|nr:uncharacterized protein DICPUDRAFT_92917 [Dictyostelium purpureum]EGC30761.1 expressed protein [Dictyostelium purpureum]|eukprot:XP_003292722.1 expressed protein [Dictyostelium purpureum]